MTTQEKAAAGRRARLRSLSAASEFHGSVWSCCHYTNEHPVSSGVREDKGRHSLSKQLIVLSSCPAASFPRHKARLRQRKRAEHQFVRNKRPRNELNRSTKIRLNL